MMRAEHITDIEGVRLWIADHDATGTAELRRCDEQYGRLEKAVSAMKIKVDKIERKIWFASGAYVFAGWMITWIVPMIVSHVTGR